MSHSNASSPDDDSDRRQLVRWSVANVPAMIDEARATDADAVVPLSESDIRRILAMAMGRAPVGTPARYLPHIRQGWRRTAFQVGLVLLGMAALIGGATAAVLAYVRWSRPVVTASGPPDASPIPPAGPTRPIDEPLPKGTWIIDDADIGFSTVGTGWSASKVGGYRGVHHYGSTGAVSASWTFERLPAGRYEVYLTWSFHENRAWEAPFTLFDGERTLSTVLVDQSIVPDDLRIRGVRWRRLGEVDVASGRFVVKLDATRAKVHHSRGYGASTSADAVLIRAAAPHAEESSGSESNE